LIFGGAFAFHAGKHERLGEQLDWAESHGCVDAAIRIMIRVDDSKWNIAVSSDHWFEDHAWTKEENWQCLNKPCQ